MSALWIAHVNVTDPDSYALYAKAAGPAIAAFGGVFLHRNGPYVQLEGQERKRNVVVRFPSVDAAVKCYRSADYQAAMEHSKNASIRDLVVVEELE